MNREFSNSVTHWIHQLNDGDESHAQQQLWDRYFERLAALARKKLKGAANRDADEEDVVLSAFESFFTRARERKFPELNDRTGLWRLLATITARKALNEVVRQHAKKRNPESGEVSPLLEEVVGQEPTPEFASQVADQLRFLLGQLEENNLREIALRKLEGHTTGEIASELGVSPSTVARKLARIRELWEDYAPGKS